VIVAVSPSEARDFVRARHYSRTAVSGIARYGWEVGGRLLGVTIYDLGVHAMRQGVFGPEHYGRVAHHHRLAVDVSAPRNTASQFLAAGLRKLHEDKPELWAVVTYADSCQSHDGAIYRATNATFTGVTARGNLKFRDEEGRLHPTQSVKGTWPERRSEAARLGWTEIRCGGKFRYVHLLGSRAFRRGIPGMLWPAVPYTEIQTIPAR
jgi:hypothetical protein